MKAMVRNIVALAAAATFSVLFMGCHARNIEKKVTVVKDYVVLNISSAVSVEWSETATEAIVTADENTIDAVKLETNGNALDIYLQVNWVINNFSGVKIVLPSSPALEEVKMSGASSFYSATPLKAGSLEVDLGGGSEFKADIDAIGRVVVECSGASQYFGNVNSAVLDLDLSGASSARISGNANKAFIELSGASSLKEHLKRLVVKEETEFSVSGASSANVDCRGDISGRVSGASSIRYGGPVKNNSVSSSGASSVRS